MKKFIALCIATVFLVGCAQEKSTTSTDANSSQSLPSVTEPVREKSDILFCGQANGTMAAGTPSEKGYYYCADFNGKYSNITYVDYDTKRVFPLCSRLECIHNNESCTAYLPTLGSIPQLCANSNKLVLAFSSAGDYYYEQYGDSARANIIIMNLDGSNKQNLIALKSGENIQIGLACDNSFVYFIKQTVLNQNVSYALCQLSLDKGQLEEIFKFSNNCFIVSADSRNIIVKEYSAPSGDTLYPDNSTQTFYCIDADTKLCINKTALPFSTKATSPQTFCAGRDLYAFYPEENDLKITDIVTMSTKDTVNNIVENPIDYGQIVRVFGDKVILSEVFSGTDIAYDFWIDAQTGETSEITLEGSYGNDAHGNFTVVPTSTYNEDFFVMTSCTTEITTLDSETEGLTEVYLLRPKFAFISQSAYFANSPIYNEIT